MLQYFRIKERDKEVKCLGPGWQSSDLVLIYRGGTDSVLGGVLTGQSSQNRARPIPLLRVLKSKPSGQSLCPRTFLAHTVVDKSSS